LPHFDRDQPLSIEGTVTEFEYVNPHSFVHLEVTNDDGGTELWWCEMPARSQLGTRGVAEDAIKVGDHIRIEGSHARRDPRGCEFGIGYLLDGTVLTVRTDGGSKLPAAPPRTDDAASLFGTWYRRSFPGAGTDPNPADFFTAAGEAADAANDPLITNPVYQCSAISPVRAWSQPSQPTEIRNEGDRIVIQHEFMDATRVIHLNMNEHAVDVPRSEMGHSIGHYEGDDLIVHTTRFSEGFVRKDFVRTTDFELVERFHINRDNGELEVNWTAIDPEYYRETLTGSRILIRTTLSPGPYDCRPGIGHGAQMDPSLG
jgi:hypothetical protein